MEVKKLIADLKLPPGYSWGFSGKYQTQESALTNMGVVLLLAICVVGIILWVEFESVMQVLLILLSVPLAGVGAFLSLWASKQTINVSSMIGAVMLVGIVVRNGIMLLDYMNAQLAEGAKLRDAIVSAALKRVRPILMTASVTILGLVPLATGWGTGAELQQPLAIAVIGGILISTLMTLLVLPAGAVLLLRDRPVEFRERLIPNGKAKGRITQREGSPAVTLE
jgi:multidrug efflux pump subunit AcrB